MCVCTGQQCFVPVITDPKNGLMEIVGLRGEEDLRGLDTNAWGIPEPAVESVDTRANGAVECTSTAHRPLAARAVLGIVCTRRCRRTYDAVR